MTKGQSMTDGGHHQFHHINSNSTIHINNNNNNHHQRGLTLMMKNDSSEWRNSINGGSNNNNINTNINKGYVVRSTVTSSSPSTISHVAVSPKRGGTTSPSSRTSPKTAYAGAKFSDPPAPASLPKPPSHWTSINGVEGNQPSLLRCTEISNQLKNLLNVQA